MFNDMITPLFVPANKLKWIQSALTSGIKVIIVDLEDSINLSDKEVVRKEFDSYLKSHIRTKVLVRINAADTEFFEKDVLLCSQNPNIIGVVLSKTQSFSDLEKLHFLDKPLFPLIETSVGLSQIENICKSSKIERIIFGSLDLSVELGLIEDSDEEDFFHNLARCEIIKYSKIAQIKPPIDGVCTVINNKNSIKKHASRAKNFGFSGVLCIHPNQVDIVLEEFLYSNEEYEWANNIVNSIDNSNGSISVDGKMVDTPVVKRARNILKNISLNGKK